MVASAHSKAAAKVRLALVKKLNLLDRGDADFLDRFDRWSDDLIEALAEIYDLDIVLPEITKVMLASHAARSENLRARDRSRVLEPDWFQKANTIGYVTYTDLFNENLAGLRERIDYLKKLKVSYLHLMPVLEPRPGANDGGYAVMNYRSLRPDLGTMDDLRTVAEELHDAGISLTLDLVLNHVAQEHEWAEKAKAGDAKYRDYFYVYPDRTIPDEFEKSLPEVFPDFAPGNFTYDKDLNGWVWTTFNAYQWDVNWANPSLFCEFADIIGNLANHGVDCLRLDAIAFIWKRLGTQCQGEDEVHAITQAIRAFARIIAPSLIFKAEAIVGPAQVGAYLGEGARAGKLSDLAYHNSLMVQIWSAIAAKDAKLLEFTLARFNAIPSNTAWGTYLRCHDDIGWAIDDSDAHQVGLNGHEHRMFLADYFTGKFWGSGSRGADFQMDKNSGERRTSGTAASLVGIEQFLEDKDSVGLDLAIRRYLCAYTMIFGFGGIPLLYMGDEIGLFNDHSYLADPEKADDSRWLNRPRMDWKIALDSAAGKKPASVHTRIRKGIENIIDSRIALPSIHATVATKSRAGRGQGVVIFERLNPAGNLTQIYNLGDGSRWVGRDELPNLDWQVVDRLTGREFPLGEGINLAQYECLWLESR
ncbi:MAG: alpha-amylase family protein [Rhodoluna sp.]